MIWSNDDGLESFYFLFVSVFTSVCRALVFFVSVFLCLFLSLSKHTIAHAHTETDPHTTDTNKTTAQTTKFQRFRHSYFMRKSSQVPISRTPLVTFKSCMILRATPCISIAKTSLSMIAHTRVNITVIKQIETYLHCASSLNKLI